MSSTSSGQNLNPILYGAICIFSLVSVYTTAVGLMLVWTEGNLIELYVIPIALAVGIGLLLLYVSLLVTDSERQLSLPAVISAYLVMVVVSIFFNFNAIYKNVAGTAIQLESLRGSERTAARLASSIDAFLREHHEIAELENQVAAKQAEMNSEEFHNMRPGRGPEHQRIKEEFNLLDAQLTRSRGDYTRVRGEVEAILFPGDGDESVGTLEAAQVQTEAVNDRIIRAVAVVEPLGYVPVQEIEQILEQGPAVDSLSFTLFTIVEETSRIVQNPDGRGQMYNVVIAAVLSLIIDVPVFLALLILRMGQTSGPAGKRRDFDDIWKSRAEVSS